MRKRFDILTWLVIGFAVIPSPAERGGWVSSGGEIFRFAKNPWFVKNTTTVHYCVKVDTATVSASEATVRTVFREAIDAWKEELSKTANPSPGFAAIGTQTFIDDGACTAQTDLRVLLGEGTLSADEIKFLQEPRRFLGVSVRTDYELESLRGRGFIYLSSDVGPRAYNTLPQTDHLIPMAWEKPRLLLYAFLHELGHVFGIPHTGTRLMSEVFLDQLLHKRFSRYYLENPVERFLVPPLNFEICGLNGLFNATFFDVPADTKCLKLEGKSQGSSIEWVVYMRRTPASAPEPAGLILADRSGQSMASAKPAAVVHLPPEQTVFSLKERFMNSFLIGPVFDEGSASGAFKKKASGRPFDLEIQLQADAITMTGLVSGRMKPVLVYSPPTLLKMVFPIDIKDAH